MRKKTLAKPLSMKQRAHKAILERILGMVYAPGTLLNRRGVAEELGMSPAPVHEAMIQLEGEGFLEALPRQGTRVRSVCREDVRGNLVVREALESQAARMICGEPLCRHKKILRPLAKAADAFSNTTSEARGQAEVAFHLALVEVASCGALLSEYRRVMQIGLFYRINLLMSTRPKEPENRHLVLLDDLAVATPDAAAECMRRHLWSGKPDALTQAVPTNQMFFA